VVLLLAVGIKVVQVASALPRAESLVPESAAAPRESAPGDESRVNVAAIQQAQLFGARDKATVPAAPAQVKSRLNVRLLGIVKGSEGSASVAILAESGRQRAYVVGDRLSVNPGARLIEILADLVVLDVSGQRQHVELEGSGLKDANISIVPSAPPRTAVLPRSIDLRQPHIHARVGNLQQGLAADSHAYERVIRLRPHVEQGRLLGYRLQPGRDADLFELLGLHDGDLLVDVEGIDLGEPPDLPRLMQLMQSEKPIRVSVRRDGQTRDIEIHL